MNDAGSITLSALLSELVDLSHLTKLAPQPYAALSVWSARPGAVISGARATDDTFRLPELDILPPDDVAAGPYRCGG